MIRLGMRLKKLRFRIISKARTIRARRNFNSFSRNKRNASNQLNNRRKQKETIK